MAKLTALRRNLRERYGPHNYRITAAGAIQAREPGSAWEDIGTVDTAAARFAGRPPDLVDGQKITLYLDGATLAAAKDLGAGNLSLGIRRAVHVAML
jgi:hypothetical protein